MLRVPKNQDITKLVRHLYSGIKTELETIFITSSGDKYIEEMDAICAEAQIQQTKESQKKRRDKIMGIVEILFKVLKEENWGLYYKNEPMRSLGTQDGGMLYEVNEIDLDEIERVFFNKLESTDKEKEDSWKTHTEPPSQEENDLNQNKS